MAYVDPRLQGKPAPAVSVTTMEKRSHRAARPGQRIRHCRREIINIVGMGVTGNVKDPGRAPKIKVPVHGFSVAYARAPRGCGAPLHRHPTEKVFLTLKGTWEVYWRSMTLGPDDIVNVPIGVYREFRNAADDRHSTLIAIVGGSDPGKVDWHPSVIEEVRKTGLAVCDDGNVTPPPFAAQ